MSFSPTSPYVVHVNEERHEYAIDGVLRPSVTQTLKDAGLTYDQWYTEEARLRGKAVHAACQLLDEDDLDWDSVLPEYRGYVTAWERFKRDSGFQITRDPEGRPLVEY